ncbi:MAG: CHAT domain-containing protein, partial [Acidobacteriia bacterium]|nr:CHAT domain-containing protein [Terriglobia bacterium]
AAQAAGAAAGAAPQPPRERIPAPLERTRAPEGAGDEIFRLAILPPNQGEEHTHLLASFRNAQVLGKIGRRGGEAGKLWQEIIAEQERIRACVDGTSDKDMPQGDELIALGEKLFQVLFPDDVRRLYDVARAEQSGRRLNVVLTSMIDWMADKPWEFAFDPCRRNFLAVEDVNFIRNVLTAIPAERIVPRAGRLRILVVVAQPLGMAHLSAEEETEVIRKGFHHLLEQGLAEVDVLLDATPDALHRELESAERPVDVLHFIGHGEYKPDVNLGYLLFENEQGGVQRLDAQVLRQIVCRRDIRLVFLNSCDSGRGGRADFNRGVAPALVAGGVPVVVANQYPVLDTSATSFARHFYWALAQGHAVGDAAREARVAVNYSIAGEAIDWAVPVVYARDPADVLCEPEQRADVRSEEAARVSANRSRRAAAPRARLVGLWDVNRVLPDLDRIAATLSACQEQFQFQAVSFSAPLGTWRPQQDGGGTCLRADKIARRLGSKPEELGVDMLIAITTLPVSDEKGRMVHTWHAAGIAILSVRGVLERLHPPLLTLERTVANAAAAIVGGLSSSARHSRTCPYFDSGSSEIESMAGRLKLCEPCRKKIGDAAVRKAVESILGAY